jgi:hypothetical protein
MWLLIEIVPGVCARCEQAFCVERRKGEANVDDETGPLVIDKACRICGCIYNRDVAPLTEAA